MAKIAYKEINFHGRTRERLEMLEAIAQEYLAKGFTLTVRQLYYQAVARGFIENNDKNYKQIADTISNGRMCGVIDWDVIEDRTRYPRANSHWGNPQDVLYSAARSFAHDKRRTQPIYCEAWIEKDALIGILEPLARRYDVPCFSCRGYPSITAVKDAADRLKAEAHRQRRVILYAGDHDPSGLDIPRDIDERLKVFGADVTMKRIGLTMEQIKKYNPPKNPAKITDTRASGYIKRHGSSSWELDALEPQVLADLFTGEIEALTDMGLYAQAKAAEDAERRKLFSVYENWPQIAAAL